MIEHPVECKCERCLLLDKIIILAKEMSRCIVSKLSGDYVRPQYWEKKRQMDELLKRLKELK